MTQNHPHDFLKTPHFFAGCKARDALRSGGDLRGIAVALRNHDVTNDTSQEEGHSDADYCAADWLPYLSVMRSLKVHKRMSLVGNSRITEPEHDAT